MFLFKIILRVRCHTMACQIYFEFRLNEIYIDIFMDYEYKRHVNFHHIIHSK